MPASAELFSVLPPAEAWAKFAEHFRPTVRRERISTDEVLGRVLADDVFAAENLPSFARSVVDGYAVIARDTFGATPGLPALLRVVGEAAMGALPDRAIGVGETLQTHTGSAITPGADAVVMVEHTQALPGAAGHIEVTRPVAVGENILGVGEDVRRGQILFARGHRLRAQDIGGLAALGVVGVDVAAKPRVGIISTGDELVPLSDGPAAGQVRDVNSFSLAALSLEAGAQPVRYGIARDDRAAIESLAHKAMRECDLIVISAGSSVSARDLTVQIIAGLGAPGVLVHGVSLKPGKPAILAMCDGVPVFGLPGNPVSAMVVFDLFVGPAVRAMLGATPQRAFVAQARMARNVASAAGREDYVPARLEQRDGEWWAVPVLGKSNLIYTLVNADAMIKIGLDSTGLARGEWVTVRRMFGAPTE